MPGRSWPDQKTDALEIMPRILVIEDDATTASGIERHLIGRGFDVLVVNDGDSGFALATQERFDAITLDRMIPGIDGLKFIEDLRSRSINTPILMISALSDVDERITILRAGGDDYLVKPFSSLEMVARVEALLRRSTPSSDESIIRSGCIEINLLQRSVIYDGKPLRLPLMEFKLLEFLARNAGKTVSRKFIFERVWGYYFDPGANLINVHIGRLRKKLDRPGQPSTISTVKGEGYRFEIV